MWVAGEDLGASCKPRDHAHTAKGRHVPKVEDRVDSLAHSTTGAGRAVEDTQAVPRRTQAVVRAPNNGEDVLVVGEQDGLHYDHR